MEDLVTTLAIVASLAAIIFGITKLVLGLRSMKFKSFELYSKMWEMCEGEDENTAILQAAVACFTTAKMSAMEIRWFVKTPRAFLYLNRYGSSTQYVEIDFINKDFKYKDKYESPIRRFLPNHGGLIGYFLFGTPGVYFLLGAFNNTLEDALKSSDLLVGMILCILSFRLLLMHSKASIAFKLTNVVLEDCK